MITPLKLTEDYIAARDLRASTERIYRISANMLTEHFGSTPIEEIDHLAILAWRKKRLGDGLSKRSWNTYSSHLRTVWNFAIEHGFLTHTTVNPFKKTGVIPAKRGSKTVSNDAIQRARQWLNALEREERCTLERSQITPAWFWLAVFEVFYYTGIRLNALLCLRVKDIDWNGQMILIRGETEKTHREFSVPIMEGLAPHIFKILEEARKLRFAPNDQLFNVNRFSRHYHGKEMNIDQVEAMYRKLTTKTGVRMTPHRFRHTLATDLKKQPERNIHRTKSLLNHSNIATTMSYVEVDQNLLRATLHDRSLAQGALRRVRRVDYSGTAQQLPPQMCLPSPETVNRLPESKVLQQQTQRFAGINADQRVKSKRNVLQQALELASAQLHCTLNSPAIDPAVDPTDQSLLLTLMANGLGLGTLKKHFAAEPAIGFSSFSKASP